MDGASTTAAGFRPTVYVVDDDLDFRSALRALLRSMGFTVESFASAEAFLGGYDPARLGCLVLDVRMPDMGGIELRDELSRRGVQAPVIFITAFGDVRMAVQAMRNGAHDFLLKPFRDQELIDSVQRAIEHAAADGEWRAECRHISERIKSLTPRELEVLRLLTRGMGNKGMAAELCLSRRTVEVHRSHVMKKMEADSLAQLVRQMVAIERSPGATH